MEKKHYQLIAFDMDGTLLDSQKRISPAVLEGIRLAQEQGKTVVLGTGRAVSELMDYREALKNVRYGVCESGGLLYDFGQDRVLWRQSFTPDVIAQVAKIAAQEDVIGLAMENGGVVIEGASLDRLARYQVSHFEKLFRHSCRRLDDFWGYVLSGGNGFEKINLYHTDVDSRARTRARFDGAPVELAYSEHTSLEVSPKGVCKGSALLKLCGLLNIPAEESIAVGDADNDLTMLRAAGLAVAMGNGNANVKAAAGAIVADNDHDGCREAIDRFLMD